MEIYKFLKLTAQKINILKVGKENVLHPHLTGVNRSGDERRLRKELRGSQQVTDFPNIPLVLLHRFYVHLLLRQQRLIARRVTSRGQELEIAMAPTQQETDPEKLLNIL